MSENKLHVGRSLLRGSAWTIAMRWAVRGLGLLNTFVLARLLAPSDFGLVAMAMVVVSFVEVLGQTGQQAALIRLPNPTRDDYDSAWTLGILIALALALLQFAVAPLATLYYHEPRAVTLIQIFALRTFIGGFENVGVVNFQKHLRFDRDFLFIIFRRVVTIGITIVFAIWLRDERALVAGILGGRLGSVVLSYLMHPYRPRWCTSRIRGMLGFSGWMLAVNIAQFVQDKVDEFVVGGFASPAAMGDYAVASDVATSPTVEVVLPFTRALFPVFARISDDAAAVRTAYLDVFSASTMISVATGLGVSLVARDYVRVVLGPAWGEAVPLVSILALAGGFYGIMETGFSVLAAVGHARLSARLTSTRAGLTVLALALAAWWGTTETVAVARTLVTMLFIPGMFLTITRVLPVSPADLLARSWRPLAAALPMAAVVTLVQSVSPDLAWLRLLLAIAAGALTYPAMILLLWRLAGRPDGLEAAALRRLDGGGAPASV